MAGVSIRVEIREGDLLVQEFQRFAKPGAKGVTRVCAEALGWLQAYQGAVNQGQWENDMQQARRSRLQALPSVAQAGD